MQIWAEAIRQMQISENEVEINFCLEIIRNNTSIPVILTADDNIVVQTRNLSDSLAIMSDSAYSARRIEGLRAKHDPIVINLPDNHKNFIYYDDSTVLKQLAHFPFIQMSIIAIFLLVAYLAFSSSRRAEQNKVWIGMSKETAHQLGTPISSLMAWTEILKEQYPDDSLLGEMEKDVRRLQLIADRFSKIGSLPEPVPSNMNEVLTRVAEYMSRRVSNKVHIQKLLPPEPVIVPLNASLFEWVIENLCKNAVDAMEGSGRITLFLGVEMDLVVVEVSDTGKGIRKKDLKSVFKPGFTTKQRGWGLGLSLAKRIVEEYHHGRIFVKASEVGRGTTFRIELKR